MCVLTCLSACGGKGGGSQIIKPIFFRFTNAVPDLAGADFLVDEEVNATSVAYGSSTGYTEYITRIGIIFFDLINSANGIALDSITIDQFSNQSDHVFAIGLVNPGLQQPLVRLVSIVIGRTTPTGSDCRVYFVHGFIRKAGRETPKIDILRDEIQQPLATAIGFGERSINTLPEGTYKFKIRIAGLEQGVLFEQSGIQLQANRVYTLLIRGIEDEVGVNAPTIQVIEEPIFNP